MPKELTPSLIKDIFAGLGKGKGAETFAYVAEDVKWTVTNPDPAGKSHPLAGQWHDLKAFQEATFGVLKDALKEPLCLKLAHEPIVADNRAVVELQAVTLEGKVPEGKNGARFDNRYAWVLTWDPQREKIAEVRAYLDSAAVNNVCA